MLQGSNAALTPDGAAFRTTHWSVVLAARDAEPEQRAQALEKLCGAYWYPLYAYVRRRGYSEPDAQDLTQGFFAHLLRNERLGNPTPDRGRFRSFLLASLKHFLSDEYERLRAQKRGGGQIVLSIDAQKAEERFQLEPWHEETPETLFERQWAMTVLNNALARLEEEFAAAGKGPLLSELRTFLSEGMADRTYADVARAVGMTEEAVKKAAQRTRRRYREILRGVIGHTVATSDEIEEELRHLWVAIGT